MGLQQQFFSDSQVFSAPQPQYPLLDLSEPNALRLMSSPASSSSLISLSAESSDSSHIFSIPTTSAATALQPIPTAAATADPYLYAMQAFSQIRSLKIPNIENEELTMTRAFLAVLTSPNSSSASSAPTLHRQRAASAFRRYFSSASGPDPSSNLVTKQCLLKRAIIYYRRLNLARRERIIGSRPTNSQLHHMMLERKRREKLSESFQTLRSLLPPETKRDKASLLASAREQLSALKGQVAELRNKNQLLESQLSLPTLGASGDHGGMMSRPSENRDVEITYVPESSTSEEQNQIVDVKMRVRRECPMVDVLIRLLEFLKRDRNVSLTSVETHSGLKSSDEISAPRYVSLQLKIKGDEWEESAFLEAIRRLIDDLAPLVN